MTAPAQDLIAHLLGCTNAAVFTGAGVSTLCGIPDFRGPQGLYKNPDAERIFDIDWFHRDPSVYYKGCRELVYGFCDVQPGPVHHAVAKLEREGIVRGVITQNIDMLHQKAGSKRVMEIHGSGVLHHCVGCGNAKGFEEICDMLKGCDVPLCARCGKAYKPDITFFGEMLPEKPLEKAFELAESCELMLVLGSSLTVQPAASIPALAVRRGADLAIVNDQPTPLDSRARYRMRDLAEFAAAVLTAAPRPRPEARPEDEDFAMAADVVARERAEAAASSEPRQCPRCGGTVDGELAECWSCGKAVGQPRAATSCETPPESGR